MLFITNRYPRQSIRSRQGRTFDFDLNNNAPGNSVFFCERHDTAQYTELGHGDFLARIRDCSQRQVLIYLHGFSNLPEAVFSGALEFQALCDQQRPDEVMVVPLIWPCDNDFGIVKDYWDDQKSADASAFAFARVLEKFLAWRNTTADTPCLKRINILAHSMGNRVLRETLATWNRYDLANGVPLLFRNTFMVAADVVNECLGAGQPGELICHASRNVVVYYASDDLALRASKASNLRNKIASRRLGHSGPEDRSLVPSNVYAIDCDEVNTRYDYPTGHSYFRAGTTPGQPGVVFQHIFDTLLSGRVFPDDATRHGMILRDD